MEGIQIQTNTSASDESTHWQTVQRFAPFLSLVPYTRAIFIVGSLAYGKENHKSDIDIVVRTQSGRVWCNRLLMVFFLALIGKRRTKNKRTKRFCINATIEENNRNKEILGRLHKKQIPTKASSGFLHYAKKTAEWLLEVLFLGVLLEHLSRYMLGSYIRNKFSRYSPHSNVIYLVSPTCIVYHPPHNYIVDKMRASCG